MENFPAVVLMGLVNGLMGFVNGQVGLVSGQMR